mgnify:CR=1 FL=1
MYCHSCEGGAEPPMNEGADVDVSLAVWAVLVVAILGMLAVDLLLHRDSHVVSVREAAVWSGIWVGVAVAAGAAIWWGYGSEFGLQYFGGYLIEKSLAVDNVFVWAILLSYFAVPARYQHRVLDRKITRLNSSHT